MNDQTDFDRKLQQAIRANRLATIFAWVSLGFAVLSMTLSLARLCS